MNMWLQLVSLFVLALFLPSPITSVPFADKGSPSCQFPFIYKDASYSTCITLDDPDDKPWCSTKTDEHNNHIKDNYRSCTKEDLSTPPVAVNKQRSLGPLECQFPFIYKGVRYSTCTTKDDPDDKPWCSTKTDEKNNHIKDDYRACTEDDLSPPPVVGNRQSSLGPSECQFPFIYRGVKYLECITIGDPNEKLWCSTKTNSQHLHLKGNWMHCNNNQPEVTTKLSVNNIPTEISKECKFPFIYEGVSYTACITKKDPDGRFWCSTKTDDQNKHIKSNWKHCTSEKPLEVDDRQTTRNCWTYLEKKQGECILIEECPSLNLIMKQIRSGTARPDGMEILRNSVCDNSGSAIRICCPLPENNLRITDNLVTADKTSDCGGAFNTDKIVNGVNAQLASWPWMVLFRGRECWKCKGTCNPCPTERGPSNWNCGGVLLSKYYVLSAAHCFQNHQITFARIGEFEIGSNPDVNGNQIAPNPQDIDVERIIIHPKYGDPYNGVSCPKCNDIAIVKLKRQAIFYASFVQPICLPYNPVQEMGYSSSKFLDKVGYAAGWGTIDKARLTPAKILQQANLTIQELDFCHERQDKHPPGSILCAGQKDGQDTCGGDSGGPLMLADAYGLKWYTVGIVSYGAFVCGADYAQGIFTNVYYYMDWINGIIY